MGALDFKLGAYSSLIVWRGTVVWKNSTLPLLPDNKAQMTIRIAQGTPQGGQNLLDEADKIPRRTPKSEADHALITHAFKVIFSEFSACES